MLFDSQECDSLFEICDEPADTTSSNEPLISV